MSYTTTYTSYVSAVADLKNYIFENLRLVTSGVRYCVSGSQTFLTRGAFLQLESFNGAIDKTDDGFFFFVFMFICNRIQSF